MPWHVRHRPARHGAAVSAGHIRSRLALRRAALGQGLCDGSRRRRPIADGFLNHGLSEFVAIAVTTNRRSLAVMERIGMVRDPDGDFDHPGVPEDQPDADPPCDLPPVTQPMGQNAFLQRRFENAADPDGTPDHPDLRRTRTARCFIEINSDEAVMEFYPYRRTRAQSDELFDAGRARLAQTGYGYTAVELKATGECIGACCLANPDLEPVLPARHSRNRLADGSALLGQWLHDGGRKGGARLMDSPGAVSTKSSHLPCPKTAAPSP